MVNLIAYIGEKAMHCKNCADDMHTIMQDDGTGWCTECHSVIVPSTFLDRPKDLLDYNPPPLGGWAEDYRNNLPF